MNISYLPKISVITSVLNDSKNLIELIDSVRNQNYKNLEFIVIDGGSVDGTVDIIMQNTDIINYWISEKDSGIYCAWNKGLRVSSGDWLCFLGADDVLLPNVLNSLVVALNDRPRKLVQYVSGKTDLYRNGRYVKTTGKPYSWSEFRKFVNTGHNGALHHRSLYESFGWYNENFRCSGDYEFLLRAKNNLSTLYVDIVTTRMNLGGASNSTLRPLFETFKAHRLNRVNYFLVDVGILLKGVISFCVSRLYRKELYDTI